jgi:hypothetical protein
MPVEILDLIASPKPNKRFRIKIADGGAVKVYDFGLDGGSTYIDHQDTKKRAAYWARHCGNPKEAQLINNVIPSPALFSARLLWGSSTDLCDNLVELQTDFNKAFVHRQKK